MDYPHRVTFDAGGVYRWKCETEKEYERRSYRYTMKACEIIAVFILCIGAGFSVMLQDWEAFGIVVGSDAVFMLIAILVCKGLDALPGTMWETYMMTDEYVKTGSGRASSYTSFKKLKHVRITEKYIGLKEGLVEQRIYTPKEDMPLVRDYILSRVGGDTEILYEQSSSEAADTGGFEV